MPKVPQQSTHLTNDLSVCIESKQQNTEIFPQRGNDKALSLYGKIQSD